MKKSKQFIFGLWLVFSLPLHKAAAQQNILIPYRNGDKWGYCDTLGNITIVPKYDSAGFFGNELAKVYSKRKTGVIDKAGFVRVQPLYDEVEQDYESRGFYVTNNGKKGFAGSNGRMLVKTLYDELFIMRGNYIRVCLRAKYGLFTIDGREILPVRCNKIEEFFQGSGGIRYQDWLLAHLGKEQYLINIKTGKVRKHTGKSLGPMPDDAPQFAEMQAVPGDEVAAPPNTDVVKTMLKADDVTFFRSMDADGAMRLNENTYLVKSNDRYLLFDAWKRRLLLKKPYDSISCFKTTNVSSYLPPSTEALVAVKSHGKWGVVTDKDTVMLPFEYAAIRILQGNSAGFEFSKDGKKGAFLYHTFYPPIPAKYESIFAEEALPVNSAWQFGVFKVHINGKTGYVGENGVEYFK